jgi:hypothetical protein
MYFNTSGTRFDYDSFDFGNEAKRMTLDEAVREAADLAARDSTHFYRVVPVDDAMSRFKVEKVAKQRAAKRYYANYLARMARAGG